MIKIAYAASVLMILFSFSPLYFLGRLVWKTRLEEGGMSLIEVLMIQNRSFDAFATVYCLPFMVPIIAIFLSAVLIIWTHKENA